MKAIPRPHNTHVLGKPRDWDHATHAECEGLPVTQVDACFYSYWRPSWTEWFKVLCGRPVRLCVLSFSHPPVAVDTEE